MQRIATTCTNTDQLTLANLILQRHAGLWSTEPGSDLPIVDTRRTNYALLHHVAPSRPVLVYRLSTFRIAQMNLMLQFNGDRGHKSKRDDDVFVYLWVQLSMWLSQLLCTQHVHQSVKFRLLIIMSSQSRNNYFSETSSLGILFFISCDKLRYFFNDGPRFFIRYLGRSMYIAMHCNILRC